jgi:uncharacterized membrane protein YccC
MLATLKPFVRCPSLTMLFPPDPGALRLLSALRATVAGVLTFILVILLGTVIAVPSSDRILGFAIALFIAATVRDATAHQRLVTIALAPLAAFVATALSGVLLEQPLAAAIAVPPIMFVVAYGSALGPRYASLGMVALIAYIVGLVTRQPPDTLPIRLVVLLLAAGDAALVRHVLLPERPQAELDRLRRAIHAGIARVIGRIADAVTAGSWTDPTRAELRREVYRLGEMIMLAQSRVAALAAELPGQGNRWLHLLEIELATERVARVALRDLGGPADRAQLLATLDALRHGTEPPPQQSSGRLAMALALLDHVLHGTPRAAPAPAAAPPPASTAPGLRPAFQTAIAAGLAIVGGELVSPNRWYWAAFAAFVMFQGTRSRGESVAKGVQFIIGTLAGVVVGVLVATLLSGHEVLSLAAIVVAVFLAFQANVAAYGVMVFWITIILGLLFGMLGYFTPDLLLLRLEEAIVGAACGALVASVVLVRREHAATLDATVDFLHALGQAVDSAARALLDNSTEPDLAARVLTEEQRFRDLSAIAQSEQSGLAASRNETLRRRMLLLEACEQWSRELCQISLQSAGLNDPTLARSVRETVARIDGTLQVLISSLAKQSAIPLATDEPAEDPGPALHDEPSHRAARLLLRIDAALTHLASR